MYMLVLVKALSNFGLQQTTPNNQFTLNGLDCRKPSSIASFLSRDWCLPAPIMKGDAQQGNKRITIVQQGDLQIIQGIRCTKHVSRFLVYCGSYSHMKLFGPPTILEPAVISSDECSDMYRRRAYIYMGKTIKVELNSVVSIPMIVHGSVSSDELNVHCMGAKFLINGEQHSNMLQFETIQLNMVELSVQVKDQEVQELRDNTLLPFSCIVNKECVYGLHTYLITGNINKCKLQVIRTLEMHEVMLTHASKISTYLVNHEHKMILRPTETSRDENCDVLIHHTNYPEIKFIMDGGAPSLDTLHVQVDMDLELRQSEEYMLYRAEMLVNSKMQTIQQNLCMLRMSSLNQVERSPFHHDSLIRVRGMIVQELSCQPCKVTVNLGYQRGNACHSEYLPVYLNDEAVYLDALGLIVETPVLDQVDCNEIFTPIFETTTGKLITAGPQITEVKMTIAKPELLGYHEEPLEHLEETESLLYTQPEIKGWMDYVHASRARKALSSALTRRYCSGSPGDTCGSYKPSEPGTFNLENLVANVEAVMDWKQWALNYIQMAGQYASIIILVVWTLKIIQKLLAVLSVKQQGFNWRTAVMLNFNLDDQVRRSLLRNAPAPEPTDETTPRSLGTLP